MGVCDFANSYMTFAVPDRANTARIQLDALCRATDRRTGKTEEYVLITPCKSERMYRERGRFQDPNYDFCGVWSRTEYLIFRTFHVHDPDRAAEWEAGPNLPRFEEVRIDLRTFPTAQALTTDAQVVEATLRNRHVVARTHVASADGNTSAEIEYPVKTMNVAEPTRRFQVDTGPVIVPTWVYGDPPKGERGVEGFSVAFVCYAKLEGHTEFVLREPTPVVVGGSEVARVWHYSRIVETTAKHELFAVCGA